MVATETLKEFEQLATQRGELIIGKTVAGVDELDILTDIKGHFLLHFSILVDHCPPAGIRILFFINL